MSEKDNPLTRRLVAIVASMATVFLASLFMALQYAMNSKQPWDERIFNFGTQIIPELFGSCATIAIGWFILERGITDKKVGKRQDIRVMAYEETIVYLTELIRRANHEILLLRAHDLGERHAGDMYAALNKRIAERPRLTVNRNFLFRDTGHAKLHIEELKRGFGSEGSEVRFCYAAALGFNLAIIDGIAVLGVPENRKGNKSEANSFALGLVFETAIPVENLKHAFFELWRRSDPWIEEGTPDSEVERRLKAAYIKMSTISNILGNTVL